MSLINREALLKAYDTEHKGPPGRARELIEEAPTVEPIRHGEWKEWWPGDCALIMTGEEMLYECNLCTAKFDSKSRYCPYCGAKMDGEVSDG